MELLKGKLYLHKIDRSRLKKDASGRDFIEIILCRNDFVEPSTGKSGVLMQNTSRGERRIYLSNMYLMKPNGVERVPSKVDTLLGEIFPDS